jgi:hypothetical protein
VWNYYNHISPLPHSLLISSHPSFPTVVAKPVLCVLCTHSLYGAYVTKNCASFQNQPIGWCVIPPPKEHCTRLQRYSWALTLSFLFWGLCKDSERDHVTPRYKRKDNIKTGNWCEVWDGFIRLRLVASFQFPNKPLQQKLVSQLAIKTFSDIMYTSQKQLEFLTIRSVVSKAI